MSSLQELIKKIQVSAANPESYVYYDKSNGKIHKISSTNTADDEYSIFAIPNEDVKPILTGEKRIEEFIIFYDVSLKQVRLKEVAYEDEHKTSSTMCYQLPVIKNQNEGHILLEQIYEGIDIYIWDIAYDYSKDKFVWYNGTVYKLATDIQKNIEFDIDTHYVFIQDVCISLLPTQSHTTTQLIMQPEYSGIHVDVWYKELSHLSGQHVWLNGNVYKLLNDQPKDTEFTIDNAEVIISNVTLYADKNKSLKTVSNIKSGDTILNNNSIYSIQEVEQQFNKDKSSTFFYNTEHMLLYYNAFNKTYIKADANERYDFEIVDNNYLFLTDTATLKNGQTLLCGKQLYLVAIKKEYDIIVQQDTYAKCWKIVLNPYTKKFLITSEYSPKERLYFSVTSKYDPNILYRSLEFTVGDLLSDTTSIIPFKYDIESNASDVSIYTAKYFEYYSHEVI